MLLAMAGECSGEFEEIFDTGRQASRWVPEVVRNYCAKERGKDFF